MMSSVTAKLQWLEMPQWLGCQWLETRWSMMVAWYAVNVLYC